MLSGLATDLTTILTTLWLRFMRLCPAPASQLLVLDHWSNAVPPCRGPFCAAARRVPGGRRRPAAVVSRWFPFCVFSCRHHRPGIKARRKPQLLMYGPKKLSRVREFLSSSPGDQGPQEAVPQFTWISMALACSTPAAVCLAAAVACSTTAVVCSTTGAACLATAADGCRRRPQPT